MLFRIKPVITLEFPWTELIMLIVIMLITIRLLFKKQVLNIQTDAEHEIEYIAKNWNKK